MSRATRLLISMLVLAFVGCGGDKPAPEEARGAAGTPPPPPTEWVKPYDGWLPDTAPENTAVVRVLDERTGAPLTGAIVRRHLEMEMGPDGWGPSFEEARTDEYGIAVVRILEVRDWDSHWVAHAEGFGSDETYGVAPNEEVELLPGRDVHGRIVDALGRPAVGIPIGYKLGCGHAPEVFHTQTDANGVFVLRNVAANGDIAYSGPGIRIGYFRAALRPLDETPDTHYADPAVRFEGRIVGADAPDLGPRIVHSQTTTRGVAAHIQDDGTFVLEGVSRDSMLDLYWAPDDKGRRLDTEQYRMGVPLIWDISKPSDEDEEEDAGDDELIPWRILTPDGTPARPVDINVYRATDGREAAFDYDAGGNEPSPLALAPGAYDVVVGDATSRWIAPLQRVVVEAGKPTPIVIQAIEQPALVLEWIGEPPASCRYALAFADASGRINHDEVALDDEHAGYLPPTARARVRVQTDLCTRFFDVGPAIDGRRVVVLQWPAPTQLRFEAPADVTRVLLGNIEHDFVREGEQVVVQTHVEGRVRLRIAHWDDYAPTASGQRLIDLPPSNGELVILDPLPYAARPLGQVTLLDATGAPLENVDIDVTWFDSRSRELESDEVETDARGVATSWLFRPGARLVWNTHSRLDHGGVLVGPGPWTQRTGSARVTVTVSGPEGPLQDVAALFAGEVFAPDNAHHDDEAANGRFTFDEVAAGPQRLVITAPGHRGEQRQLILRDGEARTIEVNLQPLP